MFRWRASLTQVLHEVLQGVEGLGDVAHLGLTQARHVAQQQGHQLTAVLAHLGLEGEEHINHHVTPFVKQKILVFMLLMPGINVQNIWGLPPRYNPWQSFKSGLKTFLFARAF